MEKYIVPQNCDKAIWLLLSLSGLVQVCGAQTIL